MIITTAAFAVLAASGGVCVAALLRLQSSTIEITDVIWWPPGLHRSALLYLADLLHPKAVTH